MRIVKEDTSMEDSVVFDGNEEDNKVQNPLPEGVVLKTTTGLNVEGIQYVPTNFKLTPEIKEQLKASYGKSVKKISLMNYDFVFRVFSREEWEDEIEDWRLKTEETTKKVLSDEDADRHLLETALVFPGLSSLKRPVAEFNLPAQQMTFLNSLPAGIQPRLARFIEHYSGFFIAELIKDTDELYAEDISDEYEQTPKPSAEELEELKSMTDLPVRLVRACGEWFAIRALTWSELKGVRAKLSEGVDGDFEVKTLKRAILVGPKNFDEMPAGLVPYLFAHLKGISGLDMEGPDVFATEAEDL